MIEPKPDSACARVRARLPELLDDTLVPLAAARDRGHLEACAACAREEARHTRLLASVRTLARSEAHELDALHAAILARLTPRTRTVVAEPRLWLAAAAALLLFALGCWFGVPRAPRAEDLAPFEHLSELPDWGGLLRGLEDLTRRLS